MCPDDEALVRLANDPCSVENEVAAAHVYCCGRCTRRLEEILYPAGEPSISQGERDVIAGFVAARCRRRPSVLDRLDAFIAARSTAFFSSGVEWRLAAAPRGGAGEAGGNATTDDVCFVFASEAAVPMSSVWRAELSVPASAAGSEPLSIQVTDARGEAAGDGLLAIANTVLMVTGGAATIPFDRFLVGIKDSNVSYQRNGGASVPGSLVFF